MTRSFEIVPAGGGLAVVETYVDGRRTGMTRRLPVAAAREEGERAAGLSGGALVDHTHGPEPSLRERMDAFAGAKFRP